MHITYHSLSADIDWVALKASLIADSFHNGRTTQQLRQSFENSQIRVYAIHEGQCVGTARALSDGIGNAYVIDVWTDSGFRGHGIATEMMNRLIAGGPGQHFYLQTDDAMGFYSKLGFVEQPAGMFKISGTYLVNKTQ